MAKVYPYHSASREERRVYHDDDACPDGMRIKKENWRVGRDERPLCRHCATVDPYYTITGELHDVYHDRGDCPNGMRIRKENRISGTGRRTRCRECAKLDALG